MVNILGKLESSRAPPENDRYIYATGWHRGHDLVSTVNTRWLESSITHQQRKAMTSWRLSLRSLQFLFVCLL